MNAKPIYLPDSKTTPFACDQPRTELGRVLREIRKKIVESGTPLLDMDGLERELRERRGGQFE